MTFEFSSYAFNVDQAKDRGMRFADQLYSRGLSVSLHAATSGYGGSSRKRGLGWKYILTQSAQGNTLLAGHAMVN